MPYALECRENIIEHAHVIKPVIDYNLLTQNSHLFSSSQGWDYSISKSVLGYLHNLWHGFQFPTQTSKYSLFKLKTFKIQIFFCKSFCFKNMAMTISAKKFNLFACLPFFTFSKLLQFPRNGFQPIVVSSFGFIVPNSRKNTKTSCSIGAYICGHNFWSLQDGELV